MSAKEKFIDRYLNPDKLNLFLGGLKNLDKLSIIGYSEENRPIYGIKIGDGSIKVLIWSQMHGNETTTTKALCGLLELLENPTHRSIISKLTLYIIPQLNPDGAAQYTRLNSNNIDLNRDAVDLSQSESKVYRTCSMALNQTFALIYTVSVRYTLLAIWDYRPQYLY